MFHENSISPGISWYEFSVANRPSYPSLHEKKDCDVAIIGGGFTGLSASYHLAKAGLRVVLVDGARFGDGASGRNGGQLGTGQRQWVEKLEKNLGYERTKALFDLAEEAKKDIINLDSQIALDYFPGQLSLIHKKREIAAYQAHVENMARYGYEQLSFMDGKETKERLGSNFYYGGIRDTGTGHINPLKLVVGLASLASEAGAELYEKTPATSLEKRNDDCIVTTPDGYIKSKYVLLATNGYNQGLKGFVDRTIVPIRSYIGATAPLPIDSEILRGRESVDDSRFVVRYFRKSIDNRLLFGGVESYDNAVADHLGDRIRAQMVEIFPKLKEIEITHCWGGTVAITVERMPYIRDIMPNVTYCGGYSGHGVMLAPFMGKLYAESITEKGDRIRCFKDLKISPFPGGQTLRRPLLWLAMRFFALMDRF